MYRPSAETWPSIGPIPSRLSFLLWHPVLKVEKPEFGLELAAKYIPELSFQQWHDIGSRFSVNFWRCWASVGPYLIWHLGAHNSGNYETRDNARRTNRASASSRLCLSYVSATPWLRSPASIVARHAITLIVRLGT